MGHAVVILFDNVDRLFLMSRMKIVYTNGPGQGTEQGLAIAHDTITNKYGGRITLFREEGKGAALLIRLPQGGSALHRISGVRCETTT